MCVCALQSVCVRVCVCLMSGLLMAWLLHDVLFFLSFQWISYATLMRFKRYPTRQAWRECVLCRVCVCVRSGVLWNELGNYAAKWCWPHCRCKPKCQTNCSCCKCTWNFDINLGDLSAPQSRQRILQAFSKVSVGITKLVLELQTVQT